MRPRQHRTSVEMEVAFHDTDLLRIVWHGNYYKYMEVARTQLFKELGFPKGVPELDGYMWVVIETRCKHTAPLTFGDRFSVTAWLKDVRHRINVGFEIRKLSTGRKCAHGYTTLATLTQAGELQLETPAPLMPILAEPEQS